MLLFFEELGPLHKVYSCYPSSSRSPQRPCSNLLYSLLVSKRDTNPWLLSVMEEVGLGYPKFSTTTPVDFRLVEAFY